MNKESKEKFMLKTKPKTFKNASLDEILAQADLIINKCLSDLISSWKNYENLKNDYSTGKRKGALGDAIEELLFGLEKNNKSVADFQKENVELKVTGLKKIKGTSNRGKKGDLIAKERLSLGMIDYFKIIKETWETSSFLEKNARLLILFYLYDKQKHIFDLGFKKQIYIDILKDFPEQMLFQIRADWMKIFEKIKNGEAHLLSSGDTSFLEACTKGAGGNKKTKQPNSDENAKPRALAFKSTFLDYLFKYFNAPMTHETLIPKNETIEEFVEKKLNPLIDMADKDIAIMQKNDFNPKNKGRWRKLIEKQLAGEKKFSQLRELESSNTELRVLRFNKNGNLRESISFPAFDYIEIANQDWEESDFYELLTSKRFLFAFFQENTNNDFEFKKWHFWYYPTDKLHEAQKVWEETKKRILNSNYKFPQASESDYCHVRPHDTKALFSSKAPDGTMQKTYCFWLNNKFIAEELSEYLK